MVQLELSGSKFQTDNRRLGFLPGQTLFSTSYGSFIENVSEHGFWDGDYPDGNERLFGVRSIPATAALLQEPLRLRAFALVATARSA